MHNIKKTVTITLVILFAAAILVMIPTAIRISNLPGEIYIPSGCSKTIDLPVDTTVRSDSIGVLKLNGQSLAVEGESYKMGEPLELTAEGTGSAELSFEVFGIPVKSMKVTVGNGKKLIPGGTSIGVMLYTNGALVVGGSDITDRSGKRVNPAREAGLRSGDVIEKVNGSEVENAAHLRELVAESPSSAVELEIKRGDKNMKLTVNAVTDSSDGSQKLGVWVRDSTAGVGTLSFYDPDSEKFAGLGHAISDADTGKQLSVKNGEIIESQIIEIVRGAEGEPGELKGYFDPEQRLLGHIEKNTEFGIYGHAEEDIRNSIYTTGVYPASRDEIEKGPATILCTLDDKGVGEYGVEIMELSAQDQPEPKSFVVKVTDERLLEKTGGIVQGMSGSPVIQNGKLVGAVTHVFVNDPTRGYGLYVDWMLMEMGW